MTDTGEYSIPSAPQTVPPSIEVDEGGFAGNIVVNPSIWRRTVRTMARYACIGSLSYALLSGAQAVDAGMELRSSPDEIEAVISGSRLAAYDEAIGNLIEGEEPDIAVEPDEVYQAATTLQNQLNREITEVEERADTFEQGVFGLLTGSAVGFASLAALRSRRFKEKELADIRLSHMNRRNLYTPGTFLLRPLRVSDKDTSQLLEVVQDPATAEEPFFRWAKYPLRFYASLPLLAILTSSPFVQKGAEALDSSSVMQDVTAAVAGPVEEKTATITDPYIEQKTEELVEEYFPHLSEISGIRSSQIAEAIAANQEDQETNPGIAASLESFSEIAKVANWIRFDHIYSASFTALNFLVLISARWLSSAYGEGRRRVSRNYLEELVASKEIIG